MLLSKEITRELHELCHSGLLCRNSRFFQQERLHIGDDKARVERTRTVDISDAQPDSSGYFKNLDLLGNAPERALLRGRGDAV